MTDLILGDPFGSHRVIEPKGALPQAAWKLDNDFSRSFESEMLIDVETLNIDAASFRQMEESRGPDGVAALVLETIRDRGKQHNPITGSGGMLLGRVAKVGSAFPHAIKPGAKIATLVSLSLTPLQVRSIFAARPASAQLDVEGTAVLFSSGLFAEIPSDMPERLALAVLDVCGAPPQVARIATPGASVLILGAGGKSGILAAVEARRCVGPSGKIIGVENYELFAKELEDLGVCDAVVQCDARNPLAVRDAAVRANGGIEFDRAISCVNVPDAEMGAILATRDRGLIYFFSMTTSFTRAALGAEGVGKDVDMIVGNGYAHNHANHSLQMMRDFPAVRALFEARYCQ